MKPKPWKTLSTKMIYENPWMQLREDIAELPNGRSTIYGVVVFGDCVGVLPFVDEDQVMLESLRIKAFRDVGVAYGENQQPTYNNIMWVFR